MSAITDFTYTYHHIREIKEDTIRTAALIIPVAVAVIGTLVFVSLYFLPALHLLPGALSLNILIPSTVGSGVLAGGTLLTGLKIHYQYQRSKITCKKLIELAENNVGDLGVFGILAYHLSDKNLRQFALTVTDRYFGENKRGIPKEKQECLLNYLAHPKICELLFGEDANQPAPAELLPNPYQSMDDQFYNAIHEIQLTRIFEVLIENLEASSDNLSSHKQLSSLSDEEFQEFVLVINNRYFCRHDDCPAIPEEKRNGVFSCLATENLFNRILNNEGLINLIGDNFITALQDSRTTALLPAAIAAYQQQAREEPTINQRDNVQASTKPQSNDGPPTKKLKNESTSSSESSESEIEVLQPLDPNKEWE